MSNTPFDDHSEQTNQHDDTLSAEDWAVIHAFDALDSWNPIASHDVQAAEARQSTPSEAYASSDEMLITFATEVEEEIETMHRVLQHIEHGGNSETAQLLPLERAGHKLRGAAGSMDYRVMATLAGHIEDLTKSVLNGQTAAVVVIPVLLQAVMALQTTLVQLIETGQENNASLLDLEEEIQRRSLDLLDDETMDEDEDAPINPVYIDVRPSETQPLMSGAFFLRVDIRRIEELVRHSEQLAELQTPIESAQAKTEAAMQELQRSQQRLQHIESQFTTLLAPPHTLSSAANALSDSSLIARILNETTQGTTSTHSSHNTHTRKNKLTTKGDQTHAHLQWDELEMEQYTEHDELLRVFNEAVADVTIATNNVYTAYTQLSTLLQTYQGQIAITRNDIQFLHSAPLRVLLPRLQRAIDMSVAGQEQRIHFEVIGEATEVDQNILEVLSIPLLQLLRTCLSDLVIHEPTEEEQSPYRVRLHAQSIGNELLLEMGFSMMVQGGIIDTIREPIERLNGSISLQRNDMGGVSFHLRLPRSQGAVRCLLVRVDDQQLLVPFSQIQRIADAQQVPVDRLYALSALLNESHSDTHSTTTSPAALSSEQSSNDASSIQPMIIPLQELSRHTVGITVDEVLNECEVMVKPLAPHLQRPGIIGSAIDGTGNILLLLDLSTLINLYTTWQRTQTLSDKPLQAQKPLRTPSILIADDSTSIRQSLQHILRQKNYTLYEARDGMEALEQLTERVPDIFLLDMEMPNLNGYDLLNIMRLYPDLADVKVIVLTSRSSQKHRQRALGMGAQAYLTKPCPQDILLETIGRLLDQ